MLLNVSEFCDRVGVTSAAAVLAPLEGTIVRLKGIQGRLHTSADETPYHGVPVLYVSVVADECNFILTSTYLRDIVLEVV